MDEEWAKTLQKKREAERSSEAKLRHDLEDWWEMSNGGTMDFEMEHLGYLFDEHGLEKRSGD